MTHPYLFQLKKRNAFTALELIMAIFVLVIIIAVSVPLINHYLPGIRLSGSSRLLVSNIREVQERAISEQNQFMIRFYPNSSPAEYQLIRIIGLTQEVLREEILSTSETLTLAETISDDQITFSPDGGPSSSGNITLSVNGISKTINVSPAGFIKLE